MEPNINNNRRLYCHDTDVRAAEYIDLELGNTYGEAARQVIEVYYGGIAEQVNEVYAAIGVRVIRGISYTGEDPVSLHAPREIH